MKRKPIRINWDALEEAFEDANREQVYYLDVVDGHVLLEGEGEEDDYDDEDEDYAAAASPRPRPPSSTRLRVGHVTTELKLEWIERFVADSPELDSAFADRIRAALDSDEPAPAVIDALTEFPEAKDDWYRYRADRLHDLIDQWLAENEIETTLPPPWKRA